tara:strand:- start:1938 stop:2195 length:258 start_codon:yes stop_codon:yes gene_type:complete
MEDETNRNLGTQPLDAMLTEAGIDNHGVVAASSEQLTHKQMQRARNGRKLTKNMQDKILIAVRAALGTKEGEKELRWRDLFNYRG